MNLIYVTITATLSWIVFLLLLGSYLVKAYETDAAAYQRQTDCIAEKINAGIPREYIKPVTNGCIVIQ